MKFCPKCEVKLKKSGSGLECSKCGYVDGEKVVEKKKIVEEEPDFSLLAFEGNEGEEAWMFQTRSADEPTTRFYRCTKCKYTWRDYT